MNSTEETYPTLTEIRKFTNFSSYTRVKDANSYIDYRCKHCDGNDPKDFVLIFKDSIWDTRYPLMQIPLSSLLEYNSFNLSLIKLLDYLRIANIREDYYIGLKCKKCQNLVSRDYGSEWATYTKFSVLTEADIDYMFASQFLVDDRYKGSLKQINLWSILAHLYSIENDTDIEMAHLLPIIIYRYKDKNFVRFTNDPYYVPSEEVVIINRLQPRVSINMFLSKQRIRTKYLVQMLHEELLYPLSYLQEVFRNDEKFPVSQSFIRQLILQRIYSLNPEYTLKLIKLFEIQ
ncbi:MAG: hypothetical protein WC175_03635 [Candidatus Dojkabacteria bacterium]